MLFRIYNQGEISSLAHGWRPVIALTPGRKWITILDWTTLETASLEIALWQKLRPQPADQLNPRKVRAIMRRRLKYVTPTESIQEAFRLLQERTL
jgi:hypothetical protein